MRILKMGGTTVQVSTLHVLLNILSISSLPRVHDTSVNFECKTIISFILRFEEKKKKNAGGRLELLASIFIKQNAYFYANHCFSFHILSFYYILQKRYHVM